MIWDGFSMFQISSGSLFLFVVEFSIFCVQKLYSKAPPLPFSYSWRKAVSVLVGPGDLTTWWLEEDLIILICSFFTSYMG